MWLCKWEMIMASVIKTREFNGAVIIWVCYTIFYAIFLNIETLTYITGYLALVGEAGLDLVCAALAFVIVRRTKAPNKWIFGCFLVSFISASIADGSYNIILNILGINQFSPFIETVFDLPFALFLLFQAIGWFLIFNIIYHKNKPYLHGISMLPFIASGLIILLSFFLLPDWQVQLISMQGVYNITDTLLEVVAFPFVVIALFSAKDKRIALLASGFLIIIASDFIIRFAEVESMLLPGSILETTWVLGLLMFTAGLLIQSDNYSNPINFLEGLGSWQSLRAQIGYWLFTASLTSIFILVIINYIFANLHIKNIHNIPATLIVFAVLSALISQIMAAYLVRPFRYLNNVIRSYSNNQSLPKPDQESMHLQIEEFKELEECLYEGLKALKRQNHLESTYIQAILQYSNDIKDPVSAIKMLSEDIDELPQRKRQMLQDTAQQIKDMTNNLLNKLNIEEPNEPEKDTSNKSDSSMILVDDNENLTMAWEMEAANKGVNLAIYQTPQQFIEAVGYFDKSTSIYIDVDLSDEMNGVELSKWAYNKGFHNLYLITGSNDRDFYNLDWVKDIYDKNPPF